MNVVTEGRGEEAPLVFVHGWAMSAAVWQAQMAHFKNSRRVYAVDLPGHGHSAPSDGPLTILGCGEAIAAFLDERDLENAVLIGWSLGAQAVCHTALLAPHRVARLVLVSGTPCFTAPSASERWGTPAVKGKHFLRQMKGGFSAALHGFVHSFFDAGEPLAPEQKETILSLFLAHPPHPAAALSLLADLLVVDMREAVRRITQPSLIVHGQDDRIVPSAAVALWEELLGASRSLVIPSCGHAPFLTRTALFNSAVENFTLP